LIWASAQLWDGRRREMGDPAFYLIVSDLADRQLGVALALATASLSVAASGGRLLWGAVDVEPCADPVQWSQSLGWWLDIQLSAVGCQTFVVLQGRLFAHWTGWHRSKAAVAGTFSILCLLIAQSNPLSMRADRCLLWTMARRRTALLMMLGTAFAEANDASPIMINESAVRGALS